MTAQARELTKQGVHDFWEARACGEVYASGDTRQEQLNRQARVRYELEPYLPRFARFHEGSGKDVLEVGVGMGADHLEWARSGPRRLVGLDLTERGVAITQERLTIHGFTPDVHVGDAERLPFGDGEFDLVYSWGVLHHTPNTQRAISEVHRVLRTGGRARIMMYHHPSLVGLMLWARYALLAGRPFRSFQDIYSEHLESPGTKAYSRAQARRLCAAFSSVRVDVRIGMGDLLAGEAGQRHKGLLLRAARSLWPRRLLSGLHPLGQVLLIETTK